MKTRLEAIVAHWASVAQYYGGAAAKRFRTNLKRASTAACETADLFARFEGDDRQLVAEDIETLRKASRLLHQLAEDFEVAQRKADRIRADKEAEAEAKQRAAVKAAMIELFGTDKPSQTQPADPSVEHFVLSMARDLAYFDNAGVVEYAKSKGCDRGLFSNTYGISQLPWMVNRGQIDECARLIAENQVSAPARGHAGTRDSHGERWYHAGWEDFLAWRKVRQQVRVACQLPGSGCLPDGS